MGHDVIKCTNCGSYVMEGRNDWHCDNCGKYVSFDNAVLEIKKAENQFSLKVKKNTIETKEYTGLKSGISLLAEENKTTFTCVFHIKIDKTVNSLKELFEVEEEIKNILYEAKKNTDTYYIYSD